MQSTMEGRILPHDWFFKKSSNQFLFFRADQATNALLYVIFQVLASNRATCQEVDVIFNFPRILR